MRPTRVVCELEEYVMSGTVILLDDNTEVEAIVHADSGTQSMAPSLAAMRKKCWHTHCMFDCSARLKSCVCVTPEEEEPSVPVSIEYL